MCLFVEAICPANDRAALEVAALAASSAGLRVDLEHPSRWPWAQDRPVRARISEDGSCACSLLSDDADWNADTWSMRPDVLDRLASTLEILAVRGPHGLVVEAIWVGEEPENTVSVTPGELAEVARLGRLGTRTRYAVASDNAGERTAAPDGGLWGVSAGIAGCISQEAALDATQLKDFGTKYTAAWCSQKAASVAEFFAEDGSLTINDGAPSVGRAAITAAAQGFMTAFPDMVVAMDSISGDDRRAVYRWTLIGTNTGPGGVGKAVRISGFEEWTLAADGLIAESKGTFDEAEYSRQLGH